MELKVDKVQGGRAWDGRIVVLRGPIGFSTRSYRSHKGKVEWECISSVSTFVFFSFLFFYCLCTVPANVSRDKKQSHSKGNVPCTRSFFRHLYIMHIEWELCATTRHLIKYWWSSCTRIFKKRRRRRRKPNIFFFKWIIIPGFLLLPTAVCSIDPRRVRLDCRIINASMERAASGIYLKEARKKERNLRNDFKVEPSWKSYRNKKKTERYSE